MLKRIALIATLMLIPAFALADSSTDTVTSTGTSATGLGPATNDSSVSPTSDGTSLQPAGTTPLQSTTGDSTGLTAPSSDSSALQQPATDTNGNLEVMLGNEAEGSQQSLPSPTPSYWLWLAFVLIVVVLSGGAMLLFRANPQLMDDILVQPVPIEGPETDLPPEPLTDESLPQADLPDTGDQAMPVAASQEPPVESSADETLDAQAPSSESSPAQPAARPEAAPNTTQEAVQHHAYTAHQPNTSKKSKSRRHK